MDDDNENQDRNYKKIHPEDEKYLRNTLIKYHEQAAEDCRIIGNQKYSVLISLSVTLASFIYALTEIYKEVSKDTNNLSIPILTLDIPSLESCLSQIVNILISYTLELCHFLVNLFCALFLGKIYTLSIPSLTFNSQYLFWFIIIIALVLLIFIFYFTVTGFLFLTFHLSKLTAVSVRIEDLQRDMIFKKMGDVDLFSWNEIW